MLSPAELIKAKRDGRELGAADLRRFIEAVASGAVSDAQIGAFTMAVYFQGMSMAEQSELTLAMRDSGRTLAWAGLDGPVLDKHSTGGVGDLVSLVLAPMVAACGAYVPMISGRGLGHTGGTLDKLESIPGIDVTLSYEKLAWTVREAGLAITGQGGDLAPADGRIYAVRDVTATVDSVPLIVASILSKKLAEGLDGFVADIKTGNGAFMPSHESARELAANLNRVASAAGLPATALITDMNQPLAASAGNALEISEAVAFLAGAHRQPRLAEVVLATGSEMLLLGGLAESREEASEKLTRALDSGQAAERLARMVALQGGPPGFVEAPHEYLAPAPLVRDLEARAAGRVTSMDTRAIGLAVLGLGGGREQPGEAIDHRVGLSGFTQVGDAVEKGEPLVTIHAADEDAWQAAADKVRSAIVIGREAETLPAVYELIQ